MGKILKIILPPLFALVVGLGAGFFFGQAGKAELRSELVTQKKIAAEDKTRLTSQATRCAKRLELAKGKHRRLKASEQLLRALLEMDRRNYGLASQHLGSAKKVIEKLPESSQGKPTLVERLSAAQTLTMQLKPTAKEEITKILADLAR